MSCQNRIYNQNGNKDRNHTKPVISYGSDLCVFNIPFFTMSGASKIDCTIESCDISGVTYDTILTATTYCFTSNGLSGTCFNNVTWDTKVYQDSVLVNTDIFYVSSGLTDSPTLVDFSGSVVTSFDTLGYDYTFDGTKFIVEPDGFSELRIDINTVLDFDDNCPITGTSCDSCPSGYTLTPDDMCLYSATTAATLNGGSLYTATTGNVNSGYNNNGTLFYGSNLNGDKPYKLTTNTSLRDNSNNVIASDYSNNSEALWDSLGSTSNGRLNNCGIWTTEPNSGGSSQPTNEYIGFSDCFTAATTGTYSIGISADNRSKFKIDGELFFTSDAIGNGSNVDLSYWRIFEVELTAGKHIIEMVASNDGSNASFGAEVYDTTIDILKDMTGETQLSSVTIFTTKDYRTGDTIPLGEIKGYSCPTDYSLDLCVTGTPVCTQLIYTSSTQNNCYFTGSCPDYSEIICDFDLNQLTSGSTNVHLITGQTDINLDFTFTSNTESFIDDNTTFNFKIYKQNKGLGYFTEPPLYESESFQWSGFSGNSAFTTNVPVDSLLIDGDYLVKGFFTHDVCTEFNLLSGNRITSPPTVFGDEFNLYEPYTDFHFVAIIDVDKPEFQSFNDVNSNVATFNVISLILTGEETQYTLPPSSGYYLLSLNGLALAKDIDYIITPTTNNFGQVVYVLVFNDIIISGDILNICYSNSANETTSNITSEGLEVVSIPSGPIDGEGDNKLYYDTTHSKFEFFVEQTPLNFNSVIMTLNGIVLANNIDFYQSISNPKRFILNGDILIGDIISIYYYPTIDNGGVSNSGFTPTWFIDNAPQTTNGLFTLEASVDIDFNTTTNRIEVDYVVGQTNYSSPLPLTGSVGDIYYYRVKNEKKYNDICDNNIEMVIYSDIVKTTIETNQLNSY